MSWSVLHAVPICHAELRSNIVPLLVLIVSSMSFISLKIAIATCRETLCTTAHNTDIWLYNKSIKTYKYAQRSVWCIVSADSMTVTCRVSVERFLVQYWLVSGVHHSCRRGLCVSGQFVPRIYWLQWQELRPVSSLLTYLLNHSVLHISVMVLICFVTF